MKGFIFMVVSAMGLLAATHGHGMGPGGISLPSLLFGHAVFNRDPFSKFLSAIFSLFFFAIGNAFILYGVNKSREIGGWAVWLVAPALPLFAVASYFFFSGVLGWNLI